MTPQEEADLYRARDRERRLANYRYPSKAAIAADVNNETSAITVAVATMADALESCPLEDSLKVYAACELAIKYGGAKYAQEVMNEIIYVSNLKKGG